MPAYQDKKTKKWFFQVNKTIDGKYKQFRRTGFDKKASALEAERKFLNDFEKNIKLNVPDSFKELLHNYFLMKKGKIKDSTYYTNLGRINKHILPFFKNKKITSITRTDVLNWRNKIIDLKFSVKYTNNLISILRDILIYANIDNTIIRNLESVVNNNPKKEINFWTKEEFDKFILVVGNKRYNLIFKTLYYNGLRIGELQALTWNDLKNKSFIINKQLQVKSFNKGWNITSPKTKNSIRSVLLPDFLLQELIDYKNECKKINGFNNNWFIFGCEKPASQTSITRYKNKYCKLANVKQIKLHEFRHSHASYMIKLGANPLLLSKRLGHSDVSETLNTYSHLYPNEQEELIKLFKK